MNRFKISVEVLDSLYTKFLLPVKNCFCSVCINNSPFSHKFQASMISTRIHKCYIYVTVPGKRDQLGNFFKIELLLPQGRVGFELQNALHI